MEHLQHGRFFAVAICAIGLAATLGCGNSGLPIRIDGSSTVYPISTAAAELFAEKRPDVDVSVSQSGTSSGMGKFLLGEIDICDASRPIKDSEIQQAQEAGIEFLEFTVALDGIAVVVHPENDWCDQLTVEQLKTLWRPEAKGTVTNWQQLDSNWPDEKFKLYGPGTASGTFEYFTEVICEKKKSSRPDYTPSENDNMLVRGVAGDRGALGYFGLAYYEENANKLKLLAVDGGNGPIKPSAQTVLDGSYIPLSRPLFIYVRRSALDRPEVQEFVQFYLDNAAELAVKAKYVSASSEVLGENQQRLRTTLGATGEL